MRSNGRAFQPIHLDQRWKRIVKIGGSRPPLQFHLDASRARQQRFQSPPLMPAQPNNAKQPTRDRRRLRNDRPIYLNVIDFILEIAAIGLSVDELQPYEEVRHPESSTNI